MKFKFDKHEELTSVLCHGQSRAQGEQKKWLHPCRRPQSLQISEGGLDSTFVLMNLILGEDAPVYCRGFNLMTFRGLFQLCRGSVIGKLSGWMGYWWWKHGILLGKKICVTWGLRVSHMVKDWLYISVYLSIGKLLISVRNHAISPANVQSHSTCILSNIYKKCINIKSPEHSKSNMRQFDVKILQKNWALLPFIRELAGTL